MTDFQAETYIFRADRIRKNVTMLKVLEWLKMGDRLRDYSANSQMRCPFHGDDWNPSAHIYEHDNSFYCFRCRISLDQIGFWAKATGSSRAEAMSQIESIANLPPLRSQSLSAKPEVEHLPPTELINLMGTKLYHAKRLLTYSGYYSFWKYFDYIILYYQLKYIDEKELKKHLIGLIARIDNIFKEGYLNAFKEGAQNSK